MAVLLFLSGESWGMSAWRHSSRNAVYLQFQIRTIVIANCLNKNTFFEERPGRVGWGELRNIKHWRGVSVHWRFLVNETCVFSSNDFNVLMGGTISTTGYAWLRLQRVLRFAEMHCFLLGNVMGCINLFHHIVNLLYTLLYKDSTW